MMLSNFVSRLREVASQIHGTFSGPEQNVVAGSASVGAGSEVAIAGSEAAIAGPEVAIAGPEAAIAGPEAAIAGPEVAIAGPEAAIAGPEVAIAGSEVAIAGSEVAIAGPEAAIAGPEVAIAGSEVAIAGSEANLTLTTDDTRPPIDMSGRRLNFDYFYTTSYDISGANISWTTDVSGARRFVGNTTTFSKEPSEWAGNQTVMYTGDTTWTNAYESLNTTFITNATTAVPQTIMNNATYTCTGDVCELDSSACGCVCVTDISGGLDCSGGICMIKPISAIEIGKDTVACSNDANCCTTCPNYETCQEKQNRVACDSDACGTGAVCGTGGGCSCKKGNIIEYD